jgi:hypothetical protein
LAQVSTNSAAPDFLPGTNVSHVDEIFNFISGSTGYVQLPSTGVTQGDLLVIENHSTHPLVVYIPSSPLSSVDSANGIFNSGSFTLNAVGTTGSVVILYASISPASAQGGVFWDAIGSF